MPTARELLEQADALMRRNRGDAGIPVLTDSVPEVAPPPVPRATTAPERSGPPSPAQGTDARALRDKAPREDYRRPPDAPRPDAPPEAVVRTAAPAPPAARGPDALATPE